MTYRLVILSAAATALAACHGGKTSAPTNESAANITALDEGNLSSDVNITDVPADDGDAPTEAETNAK
ncbi:MAG: hypothetical protein ABIR08_09060 [Sphingomonas sp.]